MQKSRQSLKNNKLKRRLKTASSACLQTLLKVFTSLFTKRDRWFQGRVALGRTSQCAKFPGVQRRRMGEFEVHRLQRGKPTPDGVSLKTKTTFATNRKGGCFSASLNHFKFNIILRIREDSLTASSTSHGTYPQDSSLLSSRERSLPWQGPQNILQRLRHVLVQ